MARMKEKPHSIQLYKTEFSFFLKLQRLRFGKPLQTRNLQGLLLFLREKWIFCGAGRESTVYGISHLIKSDSKEVIRQNR